MKPAKKILLFVILITGCNFSFSQCANPINIFSFVHNGHSYEVVKENKTWTNAAACAVSRNGYLAEINDLAEQNAIFTELTSNAGITITSTQNQFGTASVWLGGSDAVTEGNWIWDGDNNGIGTQFWSGGPNGVPIGRRYTKWGTSPAEPDNSGGQDHLTIIIKPTAVNYGRWNDLISTNSIYYLIEYSTILSNQDLELKDQLNIYPNPFNNIITIDYNKSTAIDKITIVTILSQEIKIISPEEMTNNEIDVSSLNNGMYLLNVHLKNGKVVSQKIVK